MSKHSILFLIIIFSIILYVIIKLIYQKLKDSNKLPDSVYMQSEELLDVASKKGLIIFAKIVTMYTAETWEVEYYELYGDSSRTTQSVENLNHYILSNTMGVLSDLPDNRVSYMPIIEYSVEGKKYTLPYYRYVSSRDMNFKDGQTIRIVHSQKYPDFFIIHGDKQSYCYLESILDIAPVY